jgi:26S proteasome regulatory subunit N1
MYIGYGAPSVDSANQNLASTYVNAFVNAAFGVDKLVASPEDTAEWIFKNKDHGKCIVNTLFGYAYRRFR